MKLWQISISCWHWWAGEGKKSELKLKTKQQFSGSVILTNAFSRKVQKQGLLVTLEFTDLAQLAELHSCTNIDYELVHDGFALWKQLYFLVNA